MEKQEILNELAQCHGSQQCYKHPIHPGLVYTEGVQTMAVICDAYWLLDQIMPTSLKLQEEHPFIVADLYKKETEFKCYIKYTDGNDNEIHKTEIPFTDFPLCDIDDQPAMRIWITNGTLLLPSEY